MRTAPLIAVRLNILVIYATCLASILSDESCMSMYLSLSAAGARAQWRAVTHAWLVSHRLAVPDAFPAESAPEVAGL